MAENRSIVSKMNLVKRKLNKDGSKAEWADRVGQLLKFSNGDIVVTIPTIGAWFDAEAIPEKKAPPVQVASSDVPF